MRQLLALASLIFVSHLAPAQTLPHSCQTKNVTRVGFTDKIGNGRDYELWKCGDGWHLSNLANEQAFILPDGKGGVKSCVLNSATNQQFCCPQVPSVPKTQVKNTQKGAEQEANKSSEWSCQAADSDPRSPKNILIIAPLNKDGSYSPTVYKISGDSNAKDKDVAQKDKFATMTIEVVDPNNKKTGDIRLEEPLLKTAGPATCDMKDTGNFCQLPPDIVSHHYFLDKTTDYSMKDNPDKGNGKDVQVNSTEDGHTAFSNK